MLILKIAILTMQAAFYDNSFLILSSVSTCFIVIGIAYIKQILPIEVY